MIHADMMQSVHQTPADSYHHQNKDANHNHNQAEHNRLWNSHKNSYTAIFSTDLYNIFMKPYITDHRKLSPLQNLQRALNSFNFADIRMTADCSLSQAYKFEPQFLKTQTFLPTCKRINIFYQTSQYIVMCVSWQ